MSDRRAFAVAGGAVLVVVGVVLLRRGQGAPVPVAAKEPRIERSAEAPSRSAVADTAAAHAEARRARDAMRAEILAALRRREPAAPPPAAAPARAAARSSAAPAAEEEPPHGHYEASYIREHFRADMFPLLRQCYEGALTRKPALAGKLVLKFAIVGDPQVGGVVEEAAFADESDLKDEEMETCVRESLMTLTFDKPPTGGGKVTVTYPIAFSPGDEPPPPPAPPDGESPGSARSGAPGEP